MDARIGAERLGFDGWLFRKKLVGSYGHKGKPVVQE